MLSTNKFGLNRGFFGKLLIKVRVKKGPKIKRWQNQASTPAEFQHWPLNNTRISIL